MVSQKKQLICAFWDIHPKYLCRKHTLAEHQELHGRWNILTNGKGGDIQDIRSLSPARQKVLINTIAEQKVILHDKPCECLRD